MSNAFFTERAGHGLSFAGCSGVISITNHVTIPEHGEAPVQCVGWAPRSGAPDRGAVVRV